MKTTKFNTFDDASQYSVNSKAHHSRIRPTDDGNMEIVITHADGSQEMTISPPTTRTFEESLARLEALGIDPQVRIIEH